MSLSEKALAANGQESLAGETAKAARLVFTLSIFTSAFLLFAIQPMFTKMVLPQLGGSPGVWSVAMVFFQAVLLLGYLYAHLSTRYLSPRLSVIVHMVLLIATFAALPIAVAKGVGHPPTEGQIPWLIGVFTFSVGLPFFAVAGNGPLLQAWFARTGHKDAANPYFLYGASNLGSFSALLLYPVVFETTLKLSRQSASWSAGFALLTMLIAASGFIVTRSATPSVARVRATPASAAPSLALIGKYIWLSFIPSALLVAVTAHISTDIAAAPFLWIIPLALYLLTFVLIFKDRPSLPMAVVYHLVPVMIALIFVARIAELNIFLTAAIHIAFFFAATLLCHQRLYELRPEAEHLTQFYLWMSFGGVLGGMFSGLLAPLIFNRVLEYPILASLVMLVHPAVRRASLEQIKRQALPVLAGGLALALVMHVFPELPIVKLGVLPIILLGFSTLGLLALVKYPLVRAALVPLAFIFWEFIGGGFDKIYERSFFGVHQIALYENGQYRVLVHGTTIHGAVRIKNEDGTPYTGPVQPLSYYHPQGVLAEALHLLPPNAAGRDIGVVGLGSGAYACNGMAGDRWTYYEIDARVARIAENPAYFPFLSTCAPQAKIILGDARLTLADQAPAAYDFLLVDAFSSDSIPVHLLTREALALYMSKVRENGILTIHITNRHMELQSVAAALAKDANLVMKVRALPTVSKSFADPTRSTVVVYARKAETLSAFTAEKGWHDGESHDVAVWTDDYSNIPGAIWRKYTGVTTP
jgi:spermidine synthase